MNAKALYYYHDDPIPNKDGSIKFWCREVMSYDQIIAKHRKDFIYHNDIMEIEEHLVVTEADVFFDWITCNWASPTDMPPGIYITVPKLPKPIDYERGEKS